MAPDGRTISVRLDVAASKRLDKASALMRQSRAAFLGRAGDEAARGILLDWTARRYRQGGATLSELADETGLSVEELVDHVGGRERGTALEMFLASCRTIAETQRRPRFLQLAEQAVASLAATNSPLGREPVGARAIRETRSSYEASPAPPTGAMPETIGWRLDGDRLYAERTSDAQRGRVDALLRDFAGARPGGRGGSAALASELAAELDAGFLSRTTVARLARWCHSAGPSYRGRPQQLARALSEALFGRVIPALPRTAAGDAAWGALARGSGDAGT